MDGIDTLRSLFAQTLGLSQFGPEDNFFNQGGQSVTSMVLVTKVNEIFNRELSLADLFEAPTPTALYDRLYGLRAPNHSAARETAPVASDAVSHDTVPLSPTQEFFCMMDMGPAAGAFSLRHLMLNGWRLTGPLDIEALQGALNDVVERHEMLRTTVVRDARPRYQVIHKPRPVRLQVRNISVLPAAAREEIVDELLTKAGTEDFDVNDLPLLRALVGRFDDQDALLVLTVHHSAADAWSTQVIMRDLAVFYARRTGHDAPPLPEMRPYREFCLDEADQSGSALQADTDSALAFWREKLSGAQAFVIPSRPPAEPEPARSAYAMRNFTVDGELGDKVTRLAGRTSSTPFMVLLSAFYLFANELSGGTDLTVTTFSAGRADPISHDTVGLFINMLPIRTDIKGAGSFSDLISRVRIACIDTYSHDISFTRIEQDSAPGFLETDNGVSVSFEMIQAPMNRPGTPMGDIVYSEAYHRRTVDGPDIADGMLWVTAMESPGRFTGSIQYRRDQFSAQAVDEMVEDYLRVLSHSVNAPDEPLALHV